MSKLYTEEELQQALKSQAEMIRAEMVPDEFDYTFGDDSVLKGFYQAKRDIEENLDELINSFK